MCQHMRTAMDPLLDNTHPATDIHTSGTTPRFDIFARPVAVTEVLQSVIYMVNVFWKYLLRGTFKD